MSDSWPKPVKLHELGRGPVRLRIEPDADERARIARELDLISLPALSAELTVSPWFDGAEITGRFQAVVEQACSVSLDPFEQPLAGPVEVRVVPLGSPHAISDEMTEVEFDLESPDPPDVLDHDEIDVGAYLVEALALEIDPFPRKPGVEFDYAPPTEEVSPFAVLKGLKDPKP
ncbi:MAG: hypothetical protein JWQ46_310 [Phenylobacterium sp.]|nr:hypothetical protein [Phenylobacterium sp.]